MTFQSTPIAGTFIGYHLSFLPSKTAQIGNKIGMKTHIEFTGKETDCETVFSYFGARYYDPTLLTSWTAVNPMSDKYPSLSPYNYYAWNPMKLIDPDGREVDDYFDIHGNYLGSDNAQTNYVRIVSNTAIFNRLSKDEDGHVSHEDANFLSVSFSEASINMATEAQLKIYQYYNTTCCKKLEAYPNEKDNFTSYGMQPQIQGETGTNKAHIRHFYIKLAGNRNSGVCDNTDEIRNSFVHEGNHISRAQSLGGIVWALLNKDNKYDVEKSAYQAQMNDPTWSKCSEKFKNQVIKSAFELLWN